MTNNNNIPNHWQLKTLEDVAKWGSGGTPTSTNSTYYGGDIPWLIIGDLNDAYIISSEKKITELGLQNSSAKMVKPESVLIAMYGSIGKLGINKIPVATNQAIAFTSEIYPDISNKYIFYFLLHKRSYLHSLGKGGTQKNISQSVLKQIKIPVPTLSEQQVIVAKIEELFSELENGKQQLLTAKQQLKVYRQSLLKAAFEGKLTKYKGEWRKIKLGEVANAVDPQPSHRTPPVVPNGIPYVSIKDFDSELDKIDLDSARKVSPEVLKEHLNRYTLQLGDFVIGKIGTIGKPVRIILPQNYSLSANIVLIQPRKINPTYLYYFFQSNQIEKAFKAGTNSTTQAAFGIQKVRELVIDLPNEDEQSLIVSELESKLTVCDKIEETISQSLQQAETLKQSILKKAFEGKLINIYL